MKLEEYFQLCGKQAAQSENRLAHTEFAHVLTGGFAFIKVHCHFARVERKVCYRLMNNVQKNFSLIPVVFTNRECYNDDFFINGKVIPGVTVAKVGDTYINYAGGYGSSEESFAEQIARLCECGYTKGDWGSYQVAYSKLYKRSYWLDFQTEYAADHEKKDG